MVRVTVFVSGFTIFFANATTLLLVLNINSSAAHFVSSSTRSISLREPPHLNWSSAMFRKRRTDNDEQTTEAGRDYHEVEAS